MTTHLFAEAAQRVADGADHHVEAHRLVEQMTTEEKLNALDGDTPFWPGIMDMTSGGYHRHPWPAAAVPRLGIPGINFADGPRGCVIEGATCFPVSMARGATFDPDLERRIGQAIGKELRANGATYTGAVCTNLLRHPAWGRAQETYGEDPLHVGMMAEALTRGLQEHVLACMKHYALNSMENARFTVDVTIDEQSLHEVYLPHFKRVADAGVASVMSAYNSVNGEWCGENKTLLMDILRHEWGWDGFVTSDFIFGLRDAVESVKAGLNIEMPFMQQRALALADAVASGELAMEDIDQRVRETIATLLRFGHVFAHQPDRIVIACDDHRALAYEAAVSSMVLLQNNNAVLPVNPQTTKRIAVLGRLAGVANLGDGGSSNVFPPYAITILDGMRASFPDAVVAHADRDTDIAEAADLVVVVVGYTKADEGEWLDQTDTAKLFSLFPPMDHPTLGFQTPKPDDAATSADGAATSTPQSAGAETAEAAEVISANLDAPGQTFVAGGDRFSLRLSSDDEGLIQSALARNAHVVVAVMGGSAVVMPWLDQTAATLMIWYPGMEGGRAFGDVITGVQEPGGRLPFAIPTDEKHLVHFDRNATTETYGPLHGQWWLDHNGIAAHRSFGYGLGYADIVITKAHRSHDGKTVSVHIKNQSDRDGSTVLQVYGSTEPAIAGERRLIGFRRVSISAHSEADVNVPIDLDPLRRRVNGGWIPARTPLNVVVGLNAASSDVLAL